MTLQTYFPTHASRWFGLCTLIILHSAICTLHSGNLLVPLSDLTQRPEVSTRVTITSLDGARNIGGALVTVRPVAQFTDSNGHTTFTNVVYGRYRLDAAGIIAALTYTPATNTATPLTTNINVIVAGDFTNTLHFTNGILSGVSTP